MTRRGWLLFAVMSVIWGLPYLLIKVAVEDGFSPFVIVAGRTLLGALLLLPFAARRGTLRALRPHAGALVAYSVVELAAPWILLTHAESRISSSLAALLIASTPLVAAVIGTALGDERLDGWRLTGLGVGVLGVLALVGVDVSSVDPLAVAETAVTAVGYAAGPVIVARRLHDLPTLAVITVSLALTGLLYLPLAVTTAPAHVTATAVTAVVTLGIVCTAVAFVVFFRLIDEVGAARAPVITYVNPAVALVLGVGLLDEPLTLGIAVGFPLVIGGSVLATRRTRRAPVVVVAAALLDGDRLLAARRSAPAELAGRWELPGGKLEPGETETAALLRECREELGVEVALGEPVGTEWAIRPGVVLRVRRASVVSGVPGPLQDHDSLRWLPPDHWFSVDWLPADLPVVELLRDEVLRPLRDVTADVRVVKDAGQRPGGGT